MLTDWAGEDQRTEREGWEQRASASEMFDKKDYFVIISNVQTMLLREQNRPPLTPLEPRRGAIHMEESRNYEFAYHVTALLDEAKIPSIHQEVEQLIQKNGGVITSSQQPERRKLSYAIKHQTQSFFAWVVFSTDSDTLLPELDEWARLHTEILRHVTLKLEHESDKRAIKQAEHLERKAAKIAREGAAVKKVTAEKPAENTGKLEKQIEDVIGNL